MAISARAARSLLPGAGDVRALGLALGRFTPGAWLLALAATAGMLLVVGGTTAIFENDYFRRMTPVRPQDYVFWIVSAALVGLIAGTYAVSRASGGLGRTATGGFLADLAVGCPVCNKIVVAAIGSSGALTFYAPLQLFIGIASVLLLAMALLLRARSIAGVCPVEPEGARLSV